MLSTCRLRPSPWSIGSAQGWCSRKVRGGSREMKGMSRRRFWVLLFVLIGFAPVVCEAEQPQRVLLLHSFGPNFSPFNSFASTFRADLVGRSPKPIDIYEASLESARFAADQPN